MHVGVFIVRASLQLVMLRQLSYLAQNLSHHDATICVSLHLIMSLHFSQHDWRLWLMQPILMVAIVFWVFLSRGFEILPFSISLGGDPKSSPWHVHPADDTCLYVRF